jgi:energy-converting hydrogenase Eha subunit E
MRPARTLRSSAQTHGLLWELLTFDRLITGPVVHLIYWAGLGVIVLMGFGVVGTAIGLALRDPNLMSFLLAIPALVVGLLITAALALLWRAVCEFYVAIFRISDDLRALRLLDESDRGQPPV